MRIEVNITLHGRPYDISSELAHTVGDELKKAGLEAVKHKWKEIAERLDLPFYWDDQGGLMPMCECPSFEDVLSLYKYVGGDKDKLVDAAWETDRRNHPERAAIHNRPVLK